MKNFKTFSSVLAMLIFFMTMAQEQTVFGIVSDSSMPLSGVTVVIKGTTKGTQTDIEGKYSLKAQNGDVLIFNYTGYKTQEIEIKNKFEISVLFEKSKDYIKKQQFRYNSKGQIVNEYGRPGQLARIRLSSTNYSIDLNTVYVVDGNIITNKEMMSINPGDIVDWEVFKDSTTISLYGDKNTDIVFIVKTKKALTRRELRLLKKKNSSKN